MQLVTRRSFIQFHNLQYNFSYMANILEAFTYITMSTVPQIVEFLLLTYTVGLWLHFSAQIFCSCNVFSIEREREGKRCCILSTLNTVCCILPQKRTLAHRYHRRSHSAIRGTANPHGLSLSKLIAYYTNAIVVVTYVGGSKAPRIL